MTKTFPRLKLTLQRAPRRFAHHNAITPRQTLVHWIQTALFEDAQYLNFDLTLRFVTRKEGREINRRFRGKDYATNVLTFNYQSPAQDSHKPILTSDIVLCCPVIEKEAQEQGISLEAHYAHLTVHGVLHAQGYDHIQDEPARKMMQLETRILATLGFANPYIHEE
jgi:probable rRNA maturation factor